MTGGTFPAMPSKKKSQAGMKGVRFLAIAHLILAGLLRAPFRLHNFFTDQVNICLPWRETEPQIPLRLRGRTCSLRCRLPRALRRRYSSYCHLGPLCFPEPPGFN